MNKFVALIMMALAPLANAVQWINVAQSKNSDRKVFVDASSIRVVNGYKRAWIMDSYSSPQTLSIKKEEYKSTLALFEADCKEGRIRGLSILVKSEEMGLGSEVFSFTESDAKWEFVVPGSVGEFKYSVICAPDKVK